MLRNASKLNDLRENFNKMMVDMIALEKEQEILKVENKRKRESIDVNLDFIQRWLEKTKELREYQETPEIERADFFKPHLYAATQRSKQIMENIDSIKILEQQRHPNHYISNILSNTPSSSFIQFVESTFNLFTQLTERIKVLEKKIENIDNDSF